MNILPKGSESVTVMVIQLCDTFTEYAAQTSSIADILLKQTHVAPDSYSRKLRLFKTMWNGILGKGWLLGIFP